MFKTYNLSHREKWAEIVKEFSNLDIYYLPEYVIAFEENGEGEAQLIHYVNGTVEAINVVLKRDLSKVERLKGELLPGQYFDYITPYGYGGILFKEEYHENDIKTFVDDYLKYCNNNNIVSEFIRFNPVLKNYRKLKDHLKLEYLGPTISINVEDENQVWQDFSSKNRNTIRKSIKNSVNIYWGLSPKLQETFVKMYLETMERDHADEYYFFSGKFYESVFSELKYKMKLFYAEYEGEIISIAMILFNKEIAHYHLSASKFEYRNLAATNLLLYEVAKYASNNGIKEIHLGGGLGGKTDSLYKFKKAFNKNEDNKYYVGKIIFNEEVYSKLTSEIEKDSFFPLYRKGD